MPKNNSISANSAILNNILHLLKVKGVRQSDLARYLGISRNSVSQWKANKSTSYMNYIDKLAEFFDVSVDELLHPDKTNLYDSFIAKDELELLDLYRSVTEQEMKIAMIKAIRIFIDTFNPDLKTHLKREKSSLSKNFRH